MCNVLLAGLQRLPQGTVALAVCHIHVGTTSAQGLHNHRQVACYGPLQGAQLVWRPAKGGKHNEIYFGKRLLLRHPFQLDTVPVRLIKSRIDKDLPDGAYVMVQQLPNLCYCLSFLTSAFWSMLRVYGTTTNSTDYPMELTKHNSSVGFNSFKDCWSNCSDGSRNIFG